MGRFNRNSGRRDRDESSGGFDRRGRGRFESRDSDRGDRFERRRDHEMYEVTCDKCGKGCEVPFRPTSSKPVYCDDCFKSKKEQPSASPQYEKELDKINEKLNKIMKALKIE